MLKIIGIIVLALLGLILFALFLVLLVPVRYSIIGSFYGRFRGKASITWLLHVISVKITYEDQLDLAIRILGKRVFQKKKTDSKDNEEPEEQEDDFEWDKEDEQLFQTEEDQQKDSSEPFSKESRRNREEAETFRSSPEEYTEEIDRPDQGDREKKNHRSSENSSRKQNGPKNRNDKTTNKRNHSQKTGEKESKKGKEFKKQTTSLEQNLKEIFSQWKEKWEHFKEYKDRAADFWNNKENQKTFRLIFKQIKAVLRHILPRKAKGSIVFGFDDPSTTGSVLAILSIVYAWYGNTVEIIPVFDEKIFEAEGSLKGRVRAGTLLTRGLRVLLNKNFRRLVKGWLGNGGKKDGRT